MKTILMVAMMAVGSMVSSLAYADGFECMTQARDLNLKVYNETDPNMGTRSVGVMIVSDPSVGYPNKLIARFDSSVGTLVSTGGANYMAKVDLRFNDIGRAGENILGTKLGMLAFLKVSLDHNYNQPIPAGAFVSGQLSWLKRDGTSQSTTLVCRRYLKN